MFKLPLKNIYSRGTVFLCFILFFSYAMKEGGNTPHFRSDQIHGGKDNIAQNNSFITSYGKSLETFCSPDIFEGYGLQPIPVNEPGLKNNRWIK